MQRAHQRVHLELMVALCVCTHHKVRRVLAVGMNYTVCHTIVCTVYCCDTQSRLLVGEQCASVCSIANDS
jgi:hypothetical protein